MIEGLLEKVCGELRYLPDSELRRVWKIVATYRKRRSDSPDAAAVPSVSMAVRRQRSFRRLQAFGMWRHRADVADSVLFTTKLRRLMECGRDGG